MTLKPFGNTSQAKTIKISSPNPTLAKRLGWGMRFGFIQGGVKPFVPFLPVQGRIGDRFARAPVFSHKRAIGSNEVGPIDALVVVVGQVSDQRLGAFGWQGGLGLRKLVKRFEVR